MQHERPAIRGRGYVVDSLEAALWAFSRTNTFEEGALAAANLGDDADTTAAIYGQLAGAYYGTAAIPAEWRMRLAKRSLIEEFADRIAAGPTLAYAKAKELYNRALCQPLEAQLEDERQRISASSRTGDFREGIQAFLDKRPPAFRGE